MELMTEGYLKLRNRFLTCYIRDILLEKIPYKDLSEGNIAAHEVDAEAGAHTLEYGNIFSEKGVC